MKTAFVYSGELAKYDYGPSHPLKTLRLKLTYELVGAYGLLSFTDTRAVEAAAAEEDDALSFHDPDYLRILKASNRGISPPGASYFGIGPGDNPAFEGLYDWSMLVFGASLQAAAMVDSGDVDIAFSISGGLHHAMPCS